MLSHLLRFELVYFARQPIFRLACGVLGLFGLLLTRGRFGDSAIAFNSPFTITFQLSILSIGVVIVIALLAGHAVLRDRENRMEAIIFTTSLTHFHYVVSRFLGLFCATSVVFIFGLGGLFFGQFLPGIDPTSLQPLSLWPYLWNLIVMLLPNILFGTSLIFATAALTKNPFTTYLSGVFLYVLYWIGSMLGNSPILANASPMAPERAQLAVLLEPFGLIGFLEQSRYWTVIEKNTLLLTLEGPFLFNRLIWIGFSLSLFALTYRLFQFRDLGKKGAPRTQQQADIHPIAVDSTTPIQLVIPSSNHLARNLRAWWRQSILGTKLLIHSYPFYALIFLWCFFLGINLFESGARGEFGFPLYPLTGYLLNDLQEPLQRLGILVIIFFAGELYWHERQTGIHGLIDASPIANATSLFAKITSMMLLIVTLIALSIGVSCIFQLFRGHVQLELGLYAMLFWRVGGPLLLVGSLAILSQTLTRNKYLGMGLGFLITLSLTATITSSPLFFDHPLLRLGYVPELLYSDMAGTEYHGSAALLYVIYGLAITGVLSMITLCLWRRGENGLRFGFRGRPLRALLVSLFLLAGCAAPLIYQTMVRHPYQSPQQRARDRANYERAYVDQEFLDQPTIRAVTMEVHLLPNERRYLARGKLTFENQSLKPMQELLVGVSPLVSNYQIDLDTAKDERQDKTHGHYWFTLEQPLQPGDRGELVFSLEVERSAFQRLDHEHYILPAATYIEIDKALPFFGVNTSLWIESPRQRRRQKLPPRPQTPVSDGQVQEIEDWVDFDVTISTDTGQTIMALGQRLRDWESDGRQFSHFRTAKALPYKYAITSAIYEHHTSTKGTIPVHAYIHSGHDQNLDRMLDAAHDSLQHLSQTVGPYAQTSLNLVHLPSFSNRFAGTAYPGTVFFVEDRVNLIQARDDSIDLPYSVTAHEVAHQWWGIQLNPAAVPGARLLTEVLAESSEMIIAEKEYGPEEGQRYLQVTADLYFLYRGFRGEPEPPLTEVGYQPFVYYFKGAHAMHTARELLGDQRLNQALRALFEENPYPCKPTPHQLVDKLLAAAPEHHLQLRELFQAVVSYDINLTMARHHLQDDGAQALTLDIQATRIEQDKQGKDFRGPLNGELEIGLYRQGSLVTIETIILKEEQATISLPVAQPIDRVMLDPRRLLLEADAYDNQQKPSKDTFHSGETSPLKQQSN